MTLPAETRVSPSTDDDAGIANSFDAIRGVTCTELAVFQRQVASSVIVLLNGMAYSVVIAASHYLWRQCLYGIFEWIEYTIDARLIHINQQTVHLNEAGWLYRELKATRDIGIEQLEDRSSPCNVSQSAAKRLVCVYREQFRPLYCQQDVYVLKIAIIVLELKYSRCTLRRFRRVWT